MGIVRRLQYVVMGGIKVGQLGTGASVGASQGTFIYHLLAGSATVNVGSVTGAGSTVSEVATIPGLTASHTFLVQEEQATQNACLTLQSGKSGAGQASLTWAYTAGSGLGTAASHAATIRFIAAKT